MAQENFDRGGAGNTDATEQAKRPEVRDGFVIRSIATGDEVDFIASTKDGRMRDKVEDGLYARVDLDRFYIVDTRDEAASDA